MKACPYCQREISDETTFCWYCGRELVARPERPEVTKSSRISGRVLAILAGVLLVIVLLAIFLR